MVKQQSLPTLAMCTDLATKFTPKAESVRRMLNILSRDGDPEQKAVALYTEAMKLELFDRGASLAVVSELVGGATE